MTPGGGGVDRDIQPGVAHRVGWRPTGLVHELRRLGVDPLPSRSTVYRVLVRHGLVSAIARKRRREDYRRWKRPGPMQLWQLDIMGSVMITDPTAPGGVVEAKLISGIDDHTVSA